MARALSVRNTMIQNFSMINTHNLTIVETTSRESWTV
ncbi:hypothetical protein B0G83_112168 [Paraburkholderia sp. BL21I4N1]|nr:hypothetical protein B0G83_112168 [Paraburkholderia sp. BL21I4N1]